MGACLLGGSRPLGECSWGFILPGLHVPLSLPLCHRSGSSFAPHRLKPWAKRTFPHLHVAITESFLYNEKAKDGLAQTCFQLSYPYKGNIPVLLLRQAQETSYRNLVRLGLVTLPLLHSKALRKPSSFTCVHYTHPPHPKQCTQSPQNSRPQTTCVTPFYFLTTV